MILIIIPQEANQYILKAIKTSVIEQLRQEGLISEREYDILKKQIK